MVVGMVLALGIVGMVIAWKYPIISMPCKKCAKYEGCHTFTTPVA